MAEGRGNSRGSGGRNPADRGRGGSAAAGGRGNGAASRGGAGSGRSGGAKGGGMGGSKGAGRTGGKASGKGRPGSTERPDRGFQTDPTVPRTAEQAVYDGPPIPEDITGRELDRSVANQLKGLPEKLAQRVARHLVAAARLIDEDPRTAHGHALAARARAARVAVVREACGETAYAAGEYAEALAEFRAAKRMNGLWDYLPVMADCERALGRPEKAIELAKGPGVVHLDAAQSAEMVIVEAGARFDLGEVEGALRTLENAPLRSPSRQDWVVRLRYAYADMLLSAGRDEDALEWFHRTAAIDSDGITDATDRLEELEAANPGE